MTVRPKITDISKIRCKDTSSVLVILEEPVYKAWIFTILKRENEFLAHRGTRFGELDKLGSIYSQNIQASGGQSS